MGNRTDLNTIQVFAFQFQRARVAALVALQGTLNGQMAAKDTLYHNCHVPAFAKGIGRTWIPGGFGTKIYDNPDLDRWSFESLVPGYTTILENEYSNIARMHDCTIARLAIESLQCITENAVTIDAIFHDCLRT